MASSRWLATSFCCRFPSVSSVLCAELVGRLSPRPRPCGSESAGLSANLGIGRPFRGRNSSSTETRSSPSTLGALFELDETKKNVSLCSEPSSSLSTSTHGRGVGLTFCQVVFNLQFLLLGRHGHVQRGHGIPLRLPHRPRAIVRRHCVLSGDGDEGRGRRRRCPRWGVEHGDRHWYSVRFPAVESAASRRGKRNKDYIKYVLDRAGVLRPAVAVRFR